MHVSLFISTSLSVFDVQVGLESFRMDAKDRLKLMEERRLYNVDEKEEGEEEERINQMDDVENLAFVMTKGSLGDTIIDLVM